MQKKDVNFWLRYRIGDEIGHAVSHHAKKKKLQQARRGKTLTHFTKWF
jgi:hypothetical protein